MIASRPVNAAVWQAVLWQVAAGLLFVGMQAVVKHVGAAVPAAQSSFLRFALGLPFVLPVIPAILRAGITARQARLLAWRGAAHTGAVLLWFYAMTRIPLAEVTALNYLSPVYVMLGAVLFLGEKPSWRRAVAVLVAVAGGLVVLRPGLREVAPGHLAMLGMSAFMAVGYLLAKKLSAELPAGVIVALLSVTVTIGLAPFAAAVWVPVGGWVVLWFFVSAVFATAAHYCMTRAFAAAPLTVTQPAAFVQLLWSVLLGALMFAEPVDPLVLLGGIMILSAVVWSTLADSRERRQDAS